ncbi:hypothetical protein LTR17_014641 [Elasticomyces elasticus]|nr:hypothetical protein LTR17_014641 [Elasticomyces elasticus]
MNLFSTRDETEHREQRKKIANAYSMESLLKMEPAIDECGKLLLRKMGKYADRDEAVDLGTWLHYYAFDVVGALSFNNRFGFLEQGKDVDGIMQANAVILLYAALIGQVPKAHPFLLGNPLFPILVPQMESWNAVLAINARTEVARGGEIELEGGQGGEDMLSKWASLKAHDPSKMTTRDMVVHLSANVFAGADTTATALRAIIYFLVTNPAKMTNLQKEIDTADADGKLSNPVSDKETRTQLPYFNAVIKKAMRLHPSVGLLLERHVPVGGATICGKYLPEVGPLLASILGYCSMIPNSSRIPKVLNLSAG